MSLPPTTLPSPNNSLVLYIHTELIGVNKQQLADFRGAQASINIKLGNIFHRSTFLFPFLSIYVLRMRVVVYKLYGVVLRTVLSPQSLDNFVKSLFGPTVADAAVFKPGGHKR